MKIKFLLKAIFTSMIFSLLFFVAAGSLTLFECWFFMGCNLLTSLMNFWFIRNDEALMKERSQIGENSKGWDKLILGISALLSVLNMVVAGMDLGRYHWSPNIGHIWNFLGLLMNLIGQLFFLYARKQNRFFSSMVRIQKDRGHTVCDQGLYQWVRHPGYLGMIISLLSVPLMMGSLLAYWITLLSVVMILIRTYLEDNTLKIELEGYQTYSEKTKYKLLPYVW